MDDLAMDDLESLIRDLPLDVVAALDAEVQGGVMTRREVVRAALIEWSSTHAPRDAAVAALKRDIDEGLADLKAGRVPPFDARSIADRGRALLVSRSKSG